LNYKIIEDLIKVKSKKVRRREIRRGAKQKLFQARCLEGMPDGDLKVIAKEINYGLESSY
jgi:hypothetical protein